MRRARAAVAIVAGVIALTSAPAHALPITHPGVTVIVTSRLAVEALRGTDDLRWGLLASPQITGPLELGHLFWEGADALGGLTGALAADGLSDLLRAADLYGIQVIESGAPEAAEQFVRAKPSERGSGDLRVTAVAIADPGAAFVAERTSFVIGIDPDGSALIATRGIDVDGLLDPAGPGHPGIVTAFDLVAAIAETLEIPLPAGYPGRVLETRPDPDALRKVLALEDRLTRDRDWPASNAYLMIGILVGAALAGIMAVRGMRDAGPHGAREASRVGSVAAAVLALTPLAYLVVLFIPTGQTWIRALPLILVAIVTPFVAHARTVRRLVVTACATTIGALSVLIPVAAARPGAEPALSLWDSPLVSFRQAGLRNSLAAFIIGSLFCIFALTRMRRGAFALVAAGLLILIGAPTLGANVVAVTALATGATLAILVDRRGWARWWSLATAGVVGVAATIVALIADRPGATHAGRFVDASRDDRVGAVFDAVRARLESNLDIINRVGWPAWLGVALLLLITVPLFWDALRGIERAGTLRIASHLDARTRAGIAGALTAAAVSFVLEDTGFLTAGTIAPFAWCIALVAAVGMANGGTPSLPGPPMAPVGAHLPPSGGPGPRGGAASLPLPDGEDA